MKKLFLLLTLLPHLICGCGSATQNADDTMTEQARRQDSLALKVALMPTLDCLPFYYAERCGLFHAAGLDVRLQTFNAQMDCDTAFIRGHVDVSYTDLVRAALLQSKDTGLYVIMQADGHHELMAAKSKRVRNIRHLKEKMIGMARHSVTDLLLDTLVAQSGIDPTTVYHPQINDIVLRQDMVRNATLDAAFLTEPYITQLKTEGNNSIYDSRKQHIRLMAFMATAESMADKRKTEQLRLLLESYNRAVEQINRKENPDSIRNILLAYPVTPATANSLQLPAYAPAGNGNGTDAGIAVKFLRQRQLIPAQYNSDTLFNNSIIQALRHGQK